MNEEAVVGVHAGTGQMRIIEQESQTNRDASRTPLTK